MSDRRPVGWYLGLILIAAVTTTTAAVLAWIASDLQVRVYEFYNANQGQEFDEDTFRQWDMLSVTSYTILGLVSPLLIGGGAAIVALLAALAFRWEQRRALDQPVAEAATAAS